MARRHQSERVAIDHIEATVTDLFRVALETAQSNGLQWRSAWGRGADSDGCGECATAAAIALSTVAQVIIGNNPHTGREFIWRVLVSVEASRDR